MRQGKQLATAGSSTCMCCWFVQDEVKWRESEQKLKDEKEEVEKQKEVHRKLLLGARTKLSRQIGEIEQLKKDNEQLSARVAAGGAAAAAASGQ